MCFFAKNGHIVVGDVVAVAQCEHFHLVPILRRIRKKTHSVNEPLLKENNVFSSVCQTVDRCPGTIASLERPPPTLLLWPICFVGQETSLPLEVCLLPLIRNRDYVVFLIQQKKPQKQT